jgi:hypothetical protein
MSYGKLYVFNNNIEGEWIKKIIILLNKLYCNFKESSDEYQNGIEINSESKGVIISKKMAIFLINCYLIKYKEYYDNNGILFTYLLPVNIVLDEINFVNYLDEIYIYNYLNGVNTILNHPHFKECKNVSDIDDKISIIPNLNDRFK